MSSPSQTKTPRLLIVDDETVNIEVLAQTLPGYDLCFATDGARALGMALEQAIDLILLDVVMPGMNGFEVLRWLKSEPRTQHIPVIFVTAMSEIENEERGFDLGAVDYIAKPICPAIVRARVRTHIELKRQRDLLEEYAGLDGLTGIHNRRRFDQELARSWRKAQQSGEALTLIRASLDHFRAYHEHYGYSPANECLQRIGHALDAAFNDNDDVVARYGEEEFALLLPGSDVHHRVRRVLDVIAALEIPHVRSDTSIFVSASVGGITTHALADNTPESALALAESLQHIARDTGRDRAEVHDLIRDERMLIKLENDAD